jgi:peptide/nickel transport system substrate-binding protein
MTKSSYWEEFAKKRRTRRRFLAGTALAGSGIAALSILGCGSDEEEPADSGGTPAEGTTSGPTAASAGTGQITTAFFEDLRTLDSTTYYFSIEGAGLSQAVYDHLVEYPWMSEVTDTSAARQVVARLAESWEQPDNLTYTFKLQPGVKFHDGTDFNAEAVQYAVDRTRQLNGAPAYMVSEVVSVESPDPLTVTFSLERPSEPFLHFLAGFWSPMKIASPTYIEAHQGGDDPDASQWMISNTAGTGPYMIEKHVPGEEYVAVINPEYWRTDGNPHPERIIGRIIPETSQQRLLLEGGDLQILRRGTPYADVEAFANAGMNITRYPPSGAVTLTFNTTLKPLDDERVRQAIAAGVDYEGIVATVLRGYGVAGSSPYPRAFEGWAPDHQATVKDLERAKQLLSAANVSDASMEVIYTPGVAAFARPITEQMESDLRSVGIQLEITQETQAVATERRSSAETTPHMTFGAPHGDALSSYTWAYIWFHTKGPLNKSYHSYADVDELLDSAYTELDTPTRVGLYEEAGKILGQRLPVLTMFELDETVITRPDVGGIKVNPGYPYSFDWYSAFASA